MLFTSPFFLYIFLPLVLLCYYLSPKKFKNLTLALFSLGFYAFGEHEMVLLIILSAVVDFACGLIIDKGYRKIGLAISILFNIGILVYFKFSDFFFSNLIEVFNLTSFEKDLFAGVILPLGISFYTFQTMSYTIDVYRGQVKASKNFINFLAYVTLFPQLIAGPIVRYKTIQKELINKSLGYQNFSEGIERFIIGLAKKIIIANQCAFVVDGIFNLPPNEISALTGWIGVCMYSLQIYYDFSGYSDMAIGLGKMLGFNFPENFNFPYKSKSIQEFWQRWHITLSTWFKDYLYIPLGGNRVPKYRNILNLIIVFFVTGLWHGAQSTFVIWGLYHGVLILLEKLGLKKQLNKLPNIFSHIYFFLALNLSWVLFRSNTIADAKIYYQSMFNFNKTVNTEFLNFYITKDVYVIILLGLLFAFPWFSMYLKRVLNNSIILKPILYILLFIIITFYTTIENYNPFIYFRF
jgi:alginate O-acetyltransferase complex protein AlgI